MKEELLREWRRGDECRVMGLPAKIVLKEGNKFHVKYWGDEELELPHRVFEGHELEAL